MYFVYRITNVINNKVYIGQTNNYKRRINSHKKLLSKNKSTNPYLQQDFNMYGLQSFKFEILEECCTRCLALKRETYWMNYYGGVDSNNIYNVKGNDKDNRIYAKSKIYGLKPTSFQGHKHSKESRLKISQSLKNSYKNGNHKLAGAVSGDNFGKNNSFYGKHHTQQTRQYLSNVRTGKRKYSLNFIEQLKQKINSGFTLEHLSKEYNIPILSLKYIINHTSDYLEFGLNNKPTKRKYNKSNKV